jgi:hypothetical protein
MTCLACGAVDKAPCNRLLAGEKPLFCQRFYRPTKEELAINNKTDPAVVPMILLVGAIIFLAYISW